MLEGNNLFRAAVEANYRQGGYKRAQRINARSKQPACFGKATVAKG